MVSQEVKFVVMMKAPTIGWLALSGIEIFVFFLWVLHVMMEFRPPGFVLVLPIDFDVLFLIPRPQKFSHKLETFD